MVVTGCAHLRIIHMYIIYIEIDILSAPAPNSRDKKCSFMHYVSDALAIQLSALEDNLL